jgi:predicted  nucleic acid-binding Zn-ribbon protein
MLLTAVLIMAVPALNEATPKKNDWNKALASQEQISPSERYIYTQKGNFEIGGVGGMPSGLNLRYWFVDYFGFDMTLGSSLRRDFSSSLDLLFEFVELYGNESLRLRFFFGAGTLLGCQDGGLVSNVRLPLGLSLPFVRYPLTLSCFVAPALVVAPAIGFDINWGIAIRFNLGIATRMRQRDAAMNNRVIALQEGYNRVSEKLDETGRELNKAINELNRTGGELSTARGQLNKTMETLSSTRDELDGTKSELTTTRQKLGSTESELQETRGKLGKTREELAGVKKELDGTKTELDTTKNELTVAKRKLDDREREILDKQAELDNARSILSREMSSKERADEERQLARKQEELNKEKEKFAREKESWTRQLERQKQKSETFKSRCEARRGIINEDGYCDCREHEQWNSDRSACVCVKGYKLNPATDRCEPCETVRFDGNCTEACGDDEKRVPLSKGPHKYVCVKKCRGKNEFWSEKRNTCVCRDGYYRDEKGECVPRR